MDFLTKIKLKLLNWILYQCIHIYLENNQGNFASVIFSDLFNVGEQNHKYVHYRQVISSYHKMSK